MSHGLSAQARARLHELARMGRAASPVVSVYLNTRWADEHQRERVRVFLKQELRKARAAGADGALAADLDWIERQAAALVDQSAASEADGVALFACQPLGLRELLPVAMPLADTFVVADTPQLRPLAAALEAMPATLVVFVDTESARLIPVGPEGAGEEVTLAHEVPGHHRKGGWAALAQSRYQRHVQVHRDHHFEAVADTLARLVEEGDINHIVLAGETRGVAVFRPHLPPPLSQRVVGSIAAARYEPASELAARAAQLIARLHAEEEQAALDDALTEAAKGGRAAAGLEQVLDAAGRGAVHRLFLLQSFREPGRYCPACGALRPGDAAACPLCGGATEPCELGEALVARVLASGGRVDVVAAHEALQRLGGAAARLRYPL